MSRLYLILALTFCTFSAFSQNNLKKYLKFAQEQSQKGDYFHALKYYKKAMEIDSNTVDILWQVAETYRAYKDYRKAEYYYAKVYDREEARIYPSSLLNLGLMQKQNGNMRRPLKHLRKPKRNITKRKRVICTKKRRKNW